jgi:hypothetical protein
VSEKRTTSTQTPEEPDKGIESLPFDGLLSGITAKIKEQPFLFVIAIAALIVAVIGRGEALGSSDLRFVITVISALAFLVILGYYGREGMKLAARERQRRVTEAPRGEPSEGQLIEVAGGGKLDGALQEAPAIKSQTISVAGEGSEAKDLIQSSTHAPPDDGQE